MFWRRYHKTYHWNAVCHLLLRYSTLWMIDLPSVTMQTLHSVLCRFIIIKSMLVINVTDIDREILTGFLIPVRYCITTYHTSLKVTGWLSIIMWSSLSELIMPVFWYSSLTVCYKSIWQTLTCIYMHMYYSNKHFIIIR